jgi:hypothetical protein
MPSGSSSQRNTFAKFLRRRKKLQRLSRALIESKEWSVNDIEKALSEEALTAAVMQRYHVNNSVERELGTKLGRRWSESKN